MKKIQTFTGFLMGLSIFLTCLCIYGWVQVGKYADNLEITLQSKIEDVSKVADEMPIQEEIGTLLDIEQYSDFRDLSFEVAEKYAKFTSGDLEFSDIKSYFLAESDILTAIESYSSRRYDDHDAVFVENLVLHSLRDMGDGQFLSRVTFEYLVEVDNMKLEYPSDYSIYFDEKSKKITALAMN